MRMFSINKKEGVMDVKGILKAASSPIAVTFFCISIFGCASIPKEMKEKGFVAWNYETSINPEERGKGAPVSISVTDLESSPPERTIGGWGAILRLVPGASAFAPLAIWSNSQPLGFLGIFKFFGLEQWEIERILVDELNQNGFQAFLESEDGKIDYLIEGSVDFEIRARTHFLNLGGPGFFLSIPFCWIIPHSKYRITCTAHFDVISDDGEKVLLSEDYVSIREYNVGLLYNVQENLYTFGQKVFPQIVEDFILDLNEIPASKW